MSNIDKSFLRDISGSIDKIDLTNVNNLSNKVLSEQETRFRILSKAREMGCYKDMLLLFNKFDNLLRNCSNTKEKKDISELASYEVYKLLGGGGELYVNGKLVAKED